MAAADDYPKSAAYARAYAQGFPRSQPAEAAVMIAEIDKLRALVYALELQRRALVSLAMHSISVLEWLEGHDAMPDDFHVGLLEALRDAVASYRKWQGQ